MSATNGDVLVSAVFSEDSAMKEYSLDGQTWQAYVGAVKFTDNGSVFFRGTDEAGNISEVTNFVVGKGWELHDVFLIGARYYTSTGAVSPFFGGGFGIGGQLDFHYENFDEVVALGLAGGLEAGIVLFRNSALQLELGVAWDALWDEFESFKRRFGSGTAYIALNY